MVRAGAGSYADRLENRRKFSEKSSKRRTKISKIVVLARNRRKIVVLALVISQLHTHLVESLETLNTVPAHAHDASTAILEVCVQCWRRGRRHRVPESGEIFAEGRTCKFLQLCVQKTLILSGKAGPHSTKNHATRTNFGFHRRKLPQVLYGREKKKSQKFR